MLGPISWLKSRKIEAVMQNLHSDRQRMQLAMLGYPLYDPPHKVEERLLPDDRARENFDYFMATRQERVACFRDWLHTHFRIEASLSDAGFNHLTKWCDDYLGFLMPRDRDGYYTYFDYKRSWTGDYIGANILFDFGTLIGDHMIQKCQLTRWEMIWSLSMFPNAGLTYSVKVIRKIKKEQSLEKSIARNDGGVNYRRAVLVHEFNPQWQSRPHYSVFEHFENRSFVISEDYFRNRDKDLMLRILDKPNLLKNSTERETKQCQDANSGGGHG